MMERNAKLKIPNFHNLIEGKKAVTYYSVEIVLNGASWKINKRFNEFHALNESLKTNHGNLPWLPGKTILPVKKLEDIDKRRHGLEKYMQALTERLDVYGNRTFIHFLDLDKHKPDLELNSLEQVSRVDHKLLGFRDIYFTDDRKLYFTALSDTSTASRLDSYITNISMPWDKSGKKDEALFAVGGIEIWGKVKKKQDGYTYDRHWVKSLKSQAICLSYNEQLRMLAIGCDSGELGLYLVNKDEPSIVDQLVLEKIHSSRIMRVHIDNGQKKVYTISEDRMLRVFDIEAKGVIGEVAVSGKKLTEMVVDDRNKIAYVADRGGRINVVFVGSNPPMMKQVVHTSSEGSIRGLVADFHSNRVYCTCYEDGYIHVFRLIDSNDPEGRIEKIMSIKGMPGPRMIKL
jgi:WD40 repeat protein